MKSFIYKSFAVAISIAASVVTGFSQTRSVEHDLSPFEAIEASNGFKVTVSRSDLYGVKLTIDDALESYVDCYVKAGVLYLSLDEKKVPKDVKKQYKGRNSGDPTLVAVVYMPVLKSLTLNDESEFYNSGNLSGDSFSLSMTGNSKTSDLKIVSKTVSVTIGKNARLANANVSAEGDFTFSADGKSTAVVTCAAENLNLNISGSSEINLSADIEKKTAITTAGSSKASVSGNSNELSITGKSISSKIDASLFKVSSAVLSTTGTTADIAPEKSLELDLGKGTEISYSGDPAVKIVKIQNATVTRR